MLNRPTLVIRDGAEVRRNALLASLVLSPLWLFYIPKLMLYFVTMALGGDYFYSGPLVMLTLLEVAVLTNIGICLNNGISISSRGIHFPVRFSLQTGIWRQRAWSEIKRISFRRRGKISTTDPDELVIEIQRGLPVKLKLAGLSASDLQKFVLAVNTFAPGTPIEPPLEKVSLPGVRKHAALPDVSFTELWEHGLDRRFGATIFVPKERGEKLHGGSLTVIEQLAYGGLSAIYLVRNSAGKELVLKEFVLPAGADKDFREKASDMFSREAKILCTLSHPRIVKVHDHFVENGQNYLLLEHIRGVSLRRLIQEQGARPEHLALTWGAEIAEMLQYLHGQSPPVLHRDLTPDNLMLSYDGKLFLIDFGAANHFLGTATGTMVGKQSYISPEQFKGKATPASDLFSLGCTLHYLLTGSDAEPLSTSNPKDARSDVSSGAADLVKKLTALDADERYGDAAAVRNQITDLLSARPAASVK